MEKMNALTLIITLVVGVILTGSLLGPVITDASETERTIVNDGYFNVDTTEGDFSFSWDYDAPSTYVINDNEVSFVNSYGVDLSLVMSDSFFIRSDHNGVSVYFNGDGVGNVVANATNTTLEVNRVNGVITATNGDITRTINDSSTIYYISESGNFVMKKITDPVYLLEDSVIFARGYTTLPGPTYTSILIKGDIANGVIVSAGNTSVTISNPVINTTEVSEYVGVYSLTDITMTGTVSGTDYPITYNYFVVPAEVTAELSEHLTPGQISLIGAIPVMVIVALLMVAIGGIALRRND